jgi:hypothetical protein
MALSITVNGGGTFSASMEEGPVSFTASLGAVPGPKGDTGATGPTGVIAATAPITYNRGTQTVGISATPTFTSVTATTFNATNVAFADATTQTTAFVGEARKEYIIARNKTGSTIAKGKVVYLSGATGNKATMALAQADAEATSARTIGILVEETAANGDGKVIISGAAENIDTSAFTAGQTVYLSSSVAGGLQTTLPAAPLHGVVIGIVTRSSPSVGSIEVAIQNYQELAELSDVNVSDKANNDGLFWEASSSTWRSKTIAEVLGYTPSSLALTSFSASAPISYNSGTGAFTFDSSTFLLKSDNLSGLASVSTARTNLGLGTMATETASNYLTTAAASSTYLTQSNAASTYAPLASPALTGNPTAPTPSTGDNDTSIATTAFVNAYAPAASTTVAGKVELATDAEAVAGTSTSLAVTPFGLSMARLNPSFISFVATDASSLTSGGTSSVSSHGLRVNAGTANASYGGRVFEGSSGAGTFTNLGATSVSFSKPIWLSAKCSVVSSSETSAYFQRLTYGKRGASPGGSDIGDLAVRGFGIRCNGGGNAISLQVHDGTTLTNVTSTFSPTAGVPFDVEIYSNGSGTVTLYVNGTQHATTTAGPTGNSTAIVPTVYVESVATAAITTALNSGFAVAAVRLDLNSNP